MPDAVPPLTAEHLRIREMTDDATGWRRWGPYLSDRSWATVREDYSPDGDAWGYFPHEHARSKAYRWGEDGIAGFCDRYQLLCFAPAFWNGRDRILKERFFGLTNVEGNHGEDVKEYWFHLDNTPSHSYAKFLYKYPQQAFPYDELIRVNAQRQGDGFEYELLDTGVFDGDRYFDVFIEYAKATPEDVAIRITAVNRGPEPAALHLLPQLWFRNTWAWGKELLAEPIITRGRHSEGLTLVASHPMESNPPTIPDVYDLGIRTLYAPAGGTILLTDNETHAEAVYGPRHFSRKPHTKDAFHRHLIHGEDCLKKDLPGARAEGTKAALHYPVLIPPHGQFVLRLRLSDQMHLPHPLADVDTLMARRQREADEFYAAIHPPQATDEEKRVQRQAFAGLLWSKQNYIFDVNQWLRGDNPDYPPPAGRWDGRNVHWRHLNSLRVLSMPDTWEYPWFAAWDLAFHTVVFAQIDAGFAKHQLWYLLFEQFQHPNGQIPAYEWEFSDLNPPVHAWAVWRVYNMDRIRNDNVPDLDFLERCFHKLLINFTWWVNRVDREGNNVFEGGFLGLDNISVVDRSAPLPGGASLDQADATGWMGMFCLNMLRIALELAAKRKNTVYEGLATKFLQHYAMIARAMKDMGDRDYQLYDEKDGFFYDVLHYPDGRYKKFRARSMVGLVPLFAVERLEVKWIEQFPRFTAELNWFMKHRPEYTRDAIHRAAHDGEDTYVLTIVDEHQLRGVIDRVWDEGEFLSDYGIRSLSKAHESNPCRVNGDEIVAYEPAEALTKIKGGNSNWRGPVWLPMNFLLIESFRKLGKAFGSQFAMTPPATGGQPITFRDMARDTANRLIRLFVPDDRGTRPIYGPPDGVSGKFQSDPHWKDLVLFFEYFHGDNGAGLGASHQTGWTALVASLIDEWRR